MTEKRFTFEIKTQGNKAYTQWHDNGKPINSAETLCELLNELHEENSKLHIQNDFLKDENQHMKSVLRKNRELEERNDRQYERLGQLYDLIEKQDWETLTGIIQELKEADERLQKEWSDY